MPRPALVLAALLLLPTVARAQDKAAFVLLRGADTIATEQSSRDSITLDGTLLRPGPGGVRERLHYVLTLAPDGTALLIELAAWKAEDPIDSKARQSTRVIFKEDSVAVDEANDRTGVNTALFQTARGAVPFLHLSTAFLELATRRASAAKRDSVAVPFFNLGGGQTVTGVVRRVGADSATIQLGTVLFRLRVDPAGRILGGALPSQNLSISRGATH